MTPEEIRTFVGHSPSAYNPDALMGCQIIVLRELVAQLAEHNELLRLEADRREQIRILITEAIGTFRELAKRFL